MYNNENWFGTVVDFELTNVILFDQIQHYLPNLMENFLIYLCMIIICRLHIHIIYNIERPWSSGQDSG